MQLLQAYICKGLSIKDIRSQEGGGLFSADILLTRGGGGSSDADVRTFGAKIIGFFEIYGVFARTRGEGS